MKNYVMSLYFAKYKKQKIVSINHATQLRPIAEEFAFKLVQKDPEYNPYDYTQKRISCKVSILCQNVKDSEFKENDFEIRVYPVSYSKYFCKQENSEFFNKKECIKFFFENLKNKKFVTFGKKLQHEKPLFSYYKKF